MGHWGCLGEAFAEPVERPCAYGAPVDVVGDGDINAGSVNCFPHFYLHLFHPLMGSVEVSKGVVKKFWGNTNVASLKENTGL